MKPTIANKAGMVMPSRDGWIVWSSISSYQPSRFRDSRVHAMAAGAKSLIRKASLKRLGGFNDPACTYRVHSMRHTP